MAFPNVNAAEELKSSLNYLGYGENDILCAEIWFNPNPVWDEEFPIAGRIILREGWYDEDLESFMRKLDFEYDNSYGTQYLYGTVWFKGGCWMEREEFDGREEWVEKGCPKIPKHLF